MESRSGQIKESCDTFLWGATHARIWPGHWNWSIITFVLFLSIDCQCQAIWASVWWLELGFLWLGQVYALGGGWGGGRTADQTSPCAVGRESDPSNVLEVYCYTLLAQGKRVSRFSLHILFKSWKANWIFYWATFCISLQKNGCSELIVLEFESLAYSFRGRVLGSKLPMVRAKKNLKHMWYWWVSNWWHILVAMLNQVCIANILLATLTTY